MRVGRFTVLGELGAGGMGRVYRAHDPTLQREVAIKILRDDFAGTRGDLLSEARLASALNHPHICTVYDIGDVEGSSFIAMELVEGKPLNELIVPGGLPPETALRLAIQIAGALAHAHEHGVVHGDLKGHNVVVTRTGDVKLLDFGLARTPDRASLESMTRPLAAGHTGAAMAGTLPFMAPETLRGAALSPAADVWAFGVLLHEMVAGVRPFTGETSYELAAAIMSGVARPLPASVQPTIAAVIACCLATDPVRRYATGRELFVALEPQMSALGAPIPAPTRRRVAPSAIFASTAVVVALVGGLLWGWPRAFGGRPTAPSVSSLIVLPFDNLSRDPDQDYFADGITNALITDLSRLPTLTVISRVSSERYKALGKTSREIADELHVGAIVEGTVQRSAGQVRISVRLVDAAADRNLWGRDYTRAMEDVLALQSEVARAIAAEIRASFAPADEARLVRAPIVRPEAHEEFLKGRYHWTRRSVDSVTQAIAYFRRALDLQPDYAPAYAGLAQCYVVLSIFPLGAMSPTEALPQAVKAAERAIALDDGLAEAHMALGYARLFLLGFPAAEVSFKRAIAINPSDATTRFWYAAALSSEARFDAAIDQAQQGAAVDPVSPIARAGVAWMHHLARRFDREIEAARAALDLDSNFMLGRVRLSSGLLHQGRYDEALVEMEKARELARTPDLVAAVGYAHGRAGHRREALAALTELNGLIASRARYVSPYALALVHTGLGNRDDAFRYLEQAIDARHPAAAFLAVEPDLDPLRSDPRFAALLTRARR
jgi:eukaryotic-like serine/threonine-protein kinase